jgi:serine/threonine protein kinase
MIMDFYCCHLTSVCLCEGHLTAKSDVYSFGVVLLEMLSGRRAIDKNRPSKEQYLVEWARPYLSSKRRIFQVMDARIQGQYSSSDALKAANLAIQCLSAEPRYRPNMEEVVKALEQLHNSNNNDGSRGSRGEIPRRVHRSSSNGPTYHRKNEVSNGKPASYAGPCVSPLRT